ncbi:MAG: thioredoxin [Anaerolineales bacterium]|jgi:thioredoxin 1|nr:thioredoxin [Anaerolineales bacterium]MBM2848165.1 thioredoxin [Anaerolineales bacterium]
MATMHQFSDATFRQEVLESDRPVLVDFTAEWCGPCHMLAPVVEKLNDEWNGVVKVGKLDIDVNVETTMQYGVMGVPTLILFKSGQPAERLMGFMPKERILAKLNPHLK